MCVFFFPLSEFFHQQNLSHPPSLCRAQMENGALTGLEKTLVGELDSQPFRERDEKLPITKHHLKMVAFHAISLEDVKENSNMKYANPNFASSCNMPHFSHIFTENSIFDLISTSYELDGRTSHRHPGLWYARKRS